MAYWVMKSEPDVFSIDDLARVKHEPWDGVRNFQARNHIKAMQVDDKAFFYHSSVAVPGIVGVMRISSLPFGDKSSWDSKSNYFDAKSLPDKPLWFSVEVEFSAKFPEILALPVLKEMPALADSPLVRKGNRLSIIPLSQLQWDAIMALHTSRGK